MGDVINLNRYRKARARAEKQREAEANRARHGRTRSDRTASRREQQRSDATLDGKRLEVAVDASSKVAGDTVQPDPLAPSPPGADEGPGDA